MYGTLARLAREYYPMTIERATKIPKIILTTDTALAPYLPAQEAQWNQQLRAKKALVSAESVIAFG